MNSINSFTFKGYLYLDINLEHVPYFLLVHCVMFLYFYIKMKSTYCYVDYKELQQTILI